MTAARQIALFEDRAPRRAPPRPRPATRRQHAVYRPWQAAVIAVDPGRTSGWALSVQGDLRAAGEVPGLDLARVTEVCAAALAMAPELPAVLVIEKPFIHPRMSRANAAQTVAGIAAASEVWRQVWTAAGGVKRRIVGVYPATWRAAVLGRGMGTARRDVARESEQRTARALAADAGLFAAPGPDAAAAICIATWGARAGEVGKVLPKRFRALQAAGTAAHPRELRHGR